MFNTQKIKELESKCRVLGWECGNLNRENNRLTVRLYETECKLGALLDYMDIEFKETHKREFVKRKK